MSRGTICTLVIAVLVASAHGAQAGPMDNVGYDVSYPQCLPDGTSDLPPDASFAVVGVNGGRTDLPNPCFTHQATWAAGLSGYLAQPPASLYINTANPGPQSSVWSTDALTPYGTCDGSWSRACSWEYGRYRATETFGFAQDGSPAPLRHLLPTSYWWLDLETANTWAPEGPLNIAAIQGYITGLELQGVPPVHVGLYANRHDWTAITGLAYGEITPHFLPAHPNWVPGAQSPDAAAARCHHSYSFSGGPVLLTQYPRGGFDGNHACP